VQLIRGAEKKTPRGPAKPCSSLNVLPGKFILACGRGHVKPTHLPLPPLFCYSTPIGRIASRQTNGADERQLWRPLTTPGDNAHAQPHIVQSVRFLLRNAFLPRLPGRLREQDEVITAAEAEPGGWKLEPVAGKPGAVACSGSGKPWTPGTGPSQLVACRDGPAPDRPPPASTGSLSSI